MANGVWTATVEAVDAGATAGAFGLLLDALSAAGTAWDLATLSHAADVDADAAVTAADARAIQHHWHTGSFA